MDGHGEGGGARLSTLATPRSKVRSRDSARASGERGTENMPRVPRGTSRRFSDNGFTGLIGSGPGHVLIRSSIHEDAAGTLMNGAAGCRGCSGWEPAHWRRGYHASRKGSLKRRLFSAGIRALGRVPVRPIGQLMIFGLVTLRFLLVLSQQSRNTNLRSHKQLRLSFSSSLRNLALGPLQGADSSSIQTGTCSQPVTSLRAPRQ